MYTKLCTSFFFPNSQQEGLSPFFCWLRGNLTPTFLKTGGVYGRNPCFVLETSTLDNGEVLYRVLLGSNASNFRGLDAEKEAVLEQWWSHFGNNFLENCFRQVKQNTSRIEMEESKMMFQARLKGEMCFQLQLTSGWQRSKAAAKKSLLRRWFEQLRSRVLHQCYREIYNATPTFIMDEGSVSLEAPGATKISTPLHDEESALLGENLMFQFTLHITEQKVCLYIWLIFIVFANNMIQVILLKCTWLYL